MVFDELKQFDPDRDTEFIIAPDLYRPGRPGTYPDTYGITLSTTHGNSPRKRSMRVSS